MNEVLARTLLHFFWQGALLASFLAVALWAAGPRPARLRYALASLTLLAMAVSPLVTFLVLDQSPPATGPKPTIPLPPPAGFVVPADESAGGDVAWWVQWVPVAWLVGATLCSLRLMVAWLGALRLTRTGCTPIQDRWSLLARRLGVSRPVRFLESARVRVPAVVGWLKPYVLLPASALTSLPPAHVEALIAHELAHVARYDYLLNLLQGLVESLLFYHPAVWWVSSIMRSERECCCDDRVVAVLGGRRVYVEALLEVERARVFAPAASGAGLKQRVERMIASPGRQGSLLPFVLLLAAGLASALAPRQDDAAPAPYNKWLDEDVVYIITPEERRDFQSLRTNEDRERFIERFWKRRDPTPGTDENEFKKEHYRRIAYSDSLWARGRQPGWRTDRGRVYILYGPPDEIESHPRDELEIWRYPYLEGLGMNVVFRFEHGRLVRGPGQR